jgi:hypothetical protein
MTTQLFIYTALPPEAKPLIGHYKLKKLTEITAFSIYKKDNIILTVTGLGRNAMAAGIAYSQAIFALAGQPSVMLNVGIAGHKDDALGTIYLVDKCQDADSKKTNYPPIIFKPPCKTAGLQTAALPQLDYQLSLLYDMEASAFYETAHRFTTAELAHSLKIISDNQQNTANMLQVNQVPIWIEQHLAVIDSVASALISLADSLLGVETPNFQTLIEQFHFTATEQIQLKNLLQRWQVMTNQPIPEFNTMDYKRGKDILRWLGKKLDEVDFYL